MMMIVLFIVLIGFTYFGMIRPQKKQQQQRLQMMDKLKKGDGVVLVDGLHAKVDKINSDKTIVVDADGIYLTFERMAVQAREFQHHFFFAQLKDSPIQKIE